MKQTGLGFTAERSLSRCSRSYPSGASGERSATSAVLVPAGLICCRCKDQHGGLHSYDMEESASGNNQSLCSTYCDLRHQFYHNWSWGGC